jgi:circadian clock protein KaiC
MITKTLTGVALIDEQYGGIYRGRAMLACGRSGAGKTIFGLQFLQQGLRQGERCLMLSARLAADQVIYAEAMNFSIGEPLSAGNLILLEYQNFVPGRDREENIILPPEGFLQLKQIIDTNAIQRVVLDTVLPWVTIRSQVKLAEHVFSFVRAFDRLNTTTLLTMPKPVSPMSFRLKNALEEVVPVSAMLTFDPGSGKRFLNVTKYLGEKKLAPEMEFVIVPGMGIVNAGSAPRSFVEPPAVKAPRTDSPEPSPAPVASPARPKPSFGSVIPCSTPGGPAAAGIVRWLQKKEAPRMDAPLPEK